MPGSDLFLPLPLPSPFRGLVTTRRGGASPAPFDSLNLGPGTGDLEDTVSENWRRLTEAAGAPPGRAWLTQVHGAVVRRAKGPGFCGEGDALWTDQKGLPLTIKVADCAGVAIGHSPSGRLGNAHAGWRGAAAGVVSRLLEAMEVPAAEVVVAISPHLGPCCFEVGPEVGEAFRGRFCAPRQGDRLTMDLGAALRTELLELGVPEASIHASGACTSCSRELYFSHRRDRGRTGRMATLVWRP